MKAGCYVLHMTCDHPGCPRRSVEFVGEDKKEAFKAARTAGWVTKETWTGKDLCPTHKKVQK